VTTGFSRVNSLAQENISKTEQSGMAAALYNGVMKVRGSELGRDSDRIFVSLLVPASRCQDNAAPDWGDDRLLPNPLRFAIHQSSIVCVIKNHQYIPRIQVSWCTTGLCVTVGSTYTARLFEYHRRLTNTLEKLIVAQLFKKLPTFYVSRMFVTVSSRCHCCNFELFHSILQHFLFLVDSF